MWHSNCCEMVSHCHLWIFLMTGDAEHFYVPVEAIHLSSSEKSLFISSSQFGKGFWIFLVDLYEQAMTIFIMKTILPINILLSMNLYTTVSVQMEAFSFILKDRCNSGPASAKDWDSRERSGEIVQGLRTCLVCGWQWINPQNHINFLNTQISPWATWVWPNPLSQ